MGVEPAFDPIRDDPRFDEILEHTGYRMFFKNFSTSQMNLEKDLPDRNADRGELHDLTTLVINASDKTDDGIRPPEVRTSYAKWPFVVMAALLLWGMSWAGYHFFIESRESEPAMLLAPAGFQNPSIVVVPFASETTESSIVDPSVGVGFSDALTQRLGSIKSLRVLSASTGRAIDVTRPKEVSHELGVAFILKGRLFWGTDSVSLRADLVNAAADNVLWSETFTASNNDLSDLQTQVARKLWTSLHIEPLPLERQQIEKRSTENPTAYQEYLVGRSLMAKRSAENLRKAIISFSEAVRTDPNFALAYIGLADAYALLNLYDIEPPSDAYEQAKTNVQRALLIDDTLAEAHATLAYVKFYGERNRETAELEFRRAIQLNPSYSQAHHWFALVLAAMNDRIEAISEAQIAEQLDPKSPAVKAAKAMTYSFNGQVAEAVATCDEALQIDERFLPAIRVKRWTLAASGDIAGARAMFAKELEYSGGSVEEPGWRLIDIQLTGPEDDRAAKLKQLEEAIRAESVHRNPRSFSFEIALAYNALGETEKALDWLERSEASQSHSFNLLEVDPRIKNLHKEPRFQKLVEKLRNSPR
jgi:tetratricopeptide (TPR) repeat protein